MPRIHQNKEKYMQHDTEDLIRNKMRRENFTQEDLGHEFGISQVAVSNKLKKMKFTYSQLVYIFQKLEFSDEEILKCMKG